MIIGLKFVGPWVVGWEGIAGPAWPGLPRELTYTIVPWMRQGRTRGKTELEMVRRHVCQGAACVARQLQLVAKLRADGRPTEVAEQLLASFEKAQQQHEAHLGRLESRQVR